MKIHGDVYWKTGSLQGSDITISQDGNVRRWHAPFTGWVLADTNDLKKVYEWTTRWSDLPKFTVVPVLEDAELGEVLSKLA